MTQDFQLITLREQQEVTRVPFLSLVYRSRPVPQAKSHPCPGYSLSKPSTSLYFVTKDSVCQGWHPSTLRTHLRFRQPWQDFHEVLGQKSLVAAHVGHWLRSNCRFPETGSLGERGDLLSPAKASTDANSVSQTPGLGARGYYLMPDDSPNL